MFFLGLFLGVCLGASLLYGILFFNNKPGASKPKESEKEDYTTIKENHVPPNSIRTIEKISIYKYNGGFDSITICSYCKRTCYEGDQSDSDPCFVCGHKVHDRLNGDYRNDEYSGKWVCLNDEWQWITPLDIEQMGEKEYMKRLRQRKLNRIFDDE